METLNVKTANSVNAQTIEATVKPAKNQPTKPVKAPKNQPAKKETAKAEALVVKIGTHKVTLRSNLTSLKAFKSVVSAYVAMYGLDKKETKIVLPNNTVLSLSDLNTIKNFTRVLFPAYYLDKSGDEETKTFLAGIIEVQKVLFDTPIDFSLVGTKDGKQILALYKSASKKAVELNKVSTNLIG